MSCVHLLVLHANSTALPVFRSAHAPRYEHICLRLYSHTAALTDMCSRSNMLERPSREVRTTRPFAQNHEANSHGQEPARLVSRGRTLLCWDARNGQQ